MTPPTAAFDDGMLRRALGLRRTTCATPQNTSGTSLAFVEENPESAGQPAHLHEICRLLDGRMKVRKNGTAIEAASDIVQTSLGTAPAAKRQGPRRAPVTITVTRGHAPGVFQAAQDEGLLPPQDMARIEALIGDFPLRVVGRPID